MFGCCYIAAVADLIGMADANSFAVWLWQINHECRRAKNNRIQMKCILNRPNWFLHRFSSLLRLLNTDFNISYENSFSPKENTIFYWSNCKCVFLVSHLKSFDAFASDVKCSNTPKPARNIKYLPIHFLSTFKRNQLRQNDEHSLNYTFSFGVIERNIRIVRWNKKKFASAKNEKKWDCFSRE